MIRVTLIASALIAVVAAALAAPAPADARHARAAKACPVGSPSAKVLAARARRADRDGDGIANHRDRDVDGDGVSNRRDRNVDGDRRSNGRDRDVDGDRIPNARDLDIDGDRRANRRDGDMDGDRRRNGRDRDMDGDGRRNARDLDANADCRIDVPATVPAGAGPPMASAGLPPLPRAFFGLVADHAFAARGAARDAELDGIAATGTGMLRQKLDWATIERLPGVYDWSEWDGYVAATARKGLDVMPILFNPPLFRALSAERLRFDDAFAPGEGTWPPASNADFADFAARAVRRYGPGGSFWADNPDLPARPIRSWQVWNEPNLRAYWPGGPNAAEYTAMLRAVSQAIKQADPGAEVVAAGLPSSRSGVPLDAYLDAMYAAGAADAFDTLAVHAYAPTVEESVGIVATARGVMLRRGDGGTPIRITEVGWAGGFAGAHPFAVAEDAQATMIRRLLYALGSYRVLLGVTGVVYYAWQDAPPYAGVDDFWGLHTGLRWIDGRPKAALQAYTESVGALTAGG